MIKLVKNIFAGVMYMIVVILAILASVILLLGFALACVVAAPATILFTATTLATEE